MKLYKIYFIRNEEDNEVEPTLYAFTKEKELAKKFMETRKAKYFRLLISDEGRDEYDTLFCQRTHYELLLTRLKTYDPGKLNNIGIVKLVVTRGELTELEKTIEDFYIIFGGYFSVEPKQFTERYRKAFEILRYDILHAIAQIQNGLPFAVSPETEKICSDPNNKQKYCLNEFRLFYTRFGATLKDPG